MGVVKIGHQTSRDGRRRLKRSSFNFSDINELNQKENASGPDFADDLYLDEIVEIGCEYCLLGDQICIIPYDLYCLPDLKEVLSIKTWNSCLTEEEKFSLSAYLPDMDQEAFWLIMNELLNGQEIYFGSPLKEFFDRLKGGFYASRVTKFRKGYNFLQRKLFYHTLRAYHENLHRTFSDMKVVWSNCRFDATVEEKIRVWKLRKNPNSVDCIDLNSFPGEAHCEKRFRKSTCLLENNDLLTSPLLGKEMIAPLSGGNISESAKINAKGVLKRTTGIDSIQVGVTYRPPPKGVLKIIPTFSLPSIAQKTSTATSGLQMCMGHPMPQINHGLEPDHTSYCLRDSFINRTFRCSSKYKGAEVASSSEDNMGLSLTSSGQNLPRYMRKTDHAKDSGFRELERESHFYQRTKAVEFGGKRSREKSPWEDCAVHNMDHYYYGNHKVMQMPVSEAILSSNVNSNHHQKFSASFDQRKARDRDSSKLELNKPLCEDSGISLSPRDTGAFQITYKRRKACKKIEPVNDPVIIAKTGSTSEFTTTLAEINQHCSEILKPVKIKLKSWNDSKPQLKKGVLKILQHGSPM